MRLPLVSVAIFLTEILVLVSNVLFYSYWHSFHYRVVANVLNGSLDAFLGLRPYLKITDILAHLGRFLGTERWDQTDSFS